MGMNYKVYIGPYFVLSKEDKFPWINWDSIVFEGRGESGVNENELILIPNQKLEGIEREMNFDLDCDSIVEISPEEIDNEISAFVNLANEIIIYCNEKSIEIKRKWGIVPSWF